MNRRALITAGPVTALAAVIAWRAQAEPAETPVMALYREWKGLEVAAKTAGNTGDDQADKPYWDALYEVEDRLFLIPAADLADMMIKLGVATGFGEWGINNGPTLWAEARALVA